MIRAANAGEQAGRSVWLLLAYTVIFGAAASGHLSWLLWRYVPLHVGVFAGIGIDLPRSTLVTVAASNWFVRLLPFLVLLFVPIGGLFATAVVVAAASRRAGWIIKGVATFGLLICLAESVACAFVVHSVQAAYSAAATDARLQEYLRAFEAHPKQQPAPPVQP